MATATPSPWAGSMTALVTPFKNGAVDSAALDRLVDEQIEAGTDALIPCGTTGESPTLSHEEHDAVIEAVVRRAKGRCKVMAGTGSNSPAEALRLTRRAHEVGADAVLLVSPYYNKPTQEGLFQHFSAIARGVPIPQILYNIPGRCGVEISVDTIVRLYEAHDNIVGVKHATAPYSSLTAGVSNHPTRQYARVLASKSMPAHTANADPLLESLTVRTTSAVWSSSSTCSARSWIFFPATAATMSPLAVRFTYLNVEPHNAIA